MKNVEILEIELFQGEVYLTAIIDGDEQESKIKLKKFCEIAVNALVEEDYPYHVEGSKVIEVLENQDSEDDFGKTCHTLSHEVFFDSLGNDEMEVIKKYLSLNFENL